MPTRTLQALPKNLVGPFGLWLGNSTFQGTCVAFRAAQPGDYVRSRGSRIGRCGDSHPQSRLRMLHSLPIYARCSNHNRFVSGFNRNGIGIRLYPESIVQKGAEGRLGPWEEVTWLQKHISGPGWQKKRTTPNAASFRKNGSESPAQDSGGLRVCEGKQSRSHLASSA
jgi:hypothetical protein